jgi:hypothetical protein
VTEWTAPGHPRTHPSPYDDYIIAVQVFVGAYPDICLQHFVVPHVYRDDCPGIIELGVPRWLTNVHLSKQHLVTGQAVPVCLPTDDDAASTEDNGSDGRTAL